MLMLKTLFFKVDCRFYSFKFIHKQAAAERFKFGMSSIIFSASQTVNESIEEKDENELIWCINGKKVYSIAALK